MNTLWFYERPHPCGGDPGGSPEGFPEYKDVVVWDYVVDGKWLYQWLASPSGMSEDEVYWEWVPPFGAVSRADQLSSVDALIGVGPTNHDNGRHCLSVCSNCADLYCGGLTAAIEFGDNEVIWRDFAWEWFSGWDSVRETQWSGDFLDPPVEFRFDLTQYRSAFDDLRYRIERAKFPWETA